MKLFMPFDETLISASKNQNDQLVPYQVGMPCADWYEIIPIDRLDPAATASHNQSTAADPYCLDSQG